MRVPSGSDKSGCPALSLRCERLRRCDQSYGEGSLDALAGLGIFFVGLGVFFAGIGVLWAITLWRDYILKK